MRFEVLCSIDEACQGFQTAYEEIVGLGFLTTSKVRDGRVMRFFVIYFGYWSIGVRFSRVARE